MDNKQNKPNPFINAKTQRVIVKIISNLKFFKSFTLHPLRLCVKLSFGLYSPKHNKACL